VVASAKLAATARHCLDAPDETGLLAEVRRVAAAGQGVVKIILTRGLGARGYAPSADQAGTRIVMGALAPTAADPPVKSTHAGARWAYAARLAGIKHLNRLENVLARAEWDDPAIFEGILCDDSGRVVSGVMSNLFWVKQGELFTPDLSECGVAGVARTRLLRAAARLGIRCYIGQFRPDAILAADEVMICNSVIGVRRVARLDDMTWLPAGWTTTFNKALYEDLD
jgi:4-amino-4-deoxychorismate lyase